MNRQRYLAELQRLLVFMTVEDRAEIIRRYTALLDGAADEEVMIEALGSPTKAAIGLSRGYEPGLLPERLPGQPADVDVPAPEKEEKAAPADELWTDMPFFEVNAAPPEAEPEEEEDPEKTPAAAEKTAPPAGGSHLAKEPPRRRTVIERNMALGLGIPLFILLFAALGLPLAALCLGLMLVCAAPGCILVYGAYLVAVGGLWSLSIPADAIFLFGLALIVFAIALTVLWLGLYLAVKLAGVYIRGLRWLGGELLGRRVTVYE